MPPSRGQPPSLDALLDAARALARDELVPLEPLLLAERFDELELAPDAIRGRVREAGLWAPYLPEDLGDRGLPLSEFASLSEELGRSPLGHYACWRQAPDGGTWSS